MNKDNGGIIQIELGTMLRILWRKAGFIAVLVALCGAIAFGYSRFAMPAKYEASVLLYARSSVSGSKVNVSQAELNAAQSLVNTYIVILKTPTTLDQVIREADVPYTRTQLGSMVSAISVNGTEIFRVKVTAPDPREAADIANAIGKLLPPKISQIVEGSEARLLEEAVIPGGKSSPSVIKNTVIGMLLGGVLACAIVVLLLLKDDKIHDTQYLTDKYDLPILTVVPDLRDNGGSGYGHGGEGSGNGK